MFFSLQFEVFILGQSPHVWPQQQAWDEPTLEQRFYVFVSLSLLLYNFAFVLDRWSSIFVCYYIQLFLYISIFLSLYVIGFLKNFHLFLHSLLSFFLSLSFFRLFYCVWSLIYVGRQAASKCLPLNPFLFAFISIYLFLYLSSLCWLVYLCFSSCLPFISKYA